MLPLSSLTVTPPFPGWSRSSISSGTPERFGGGDHLVWRGRHQERVDNFVEERVGSRTVSANRSSKFVLRAAQLDVRAEQRPVRAWSCLVGHAHASGVDRAYPDDVTVELEMRVGAHKYSLIHLLEQRDHPLVGRAWREELLGRAWRAVGKPRRSEALDVKGDRGRERCEGVERSCGVLLEHPALAGSRLPRPSSVTQPGEGSLGITADEEHRPAEALLQLRR